MDHEYLQNVMGSPFVQEGAFSRLKAKGAQAMGAMGAMAGHQIQNPAETKLYSLWEGFMSSLKKLMVDWEDKVSPMFDNPRVELDGQGHTVKEALDTLASTLKSQLPSKIGSAPNQIHDPNTRNQRDNPQSYVGGSAYNRSTTSPTKLTEILGEGFWNRDIGLNKALSSNDPAKILNSYKKSVLSLFQNFMKDAVKMTKMTAQQIYATLSKMQPAQSGYQAPANMQKVVQQLQTLQNTGDVGAVPPQQPAAQPASEPSAGTETPPAGQQPQQPGATPETSPQAQQKPASGAGVQGGNGDAITPEELPHIILKAIEIINDAVSSDISHTGKYFDKDQSGQTTQLPADYGTGQSMTKEITSGPKSHTPDGGEAGETPEKEEPEDKERKGEFVYNFHSKFRKFPGTNFSIQVRPVKVNPQIEGTNISVEVWWNCEKTRNKVYAIAIKNGKKSQPMLIMEFFDQEVNSKAGATNPQSTNFFSVDKIVNAANPTGPKKLEKADSGVLQQIKAAENTLLRSLMLTVGRKSMEFKPKKDKTLPIKFDDQGNVTVYEQGKAVEQLTKQQVKDKLEKSDFETSEQWKESLNHYDYFEQFPDMKPADITDFPEFKDGVMALMKMGINEPESIKLASSAWMELRTTVSSLNDIKSDQIVTQALKKKHETGKPTEPEAGEEPPEPPKPPEPPITPPSAPPGGPPPSTPPSSPVSGVAGGPPPTTKPSAPVSTDEPKPDQGKEPPAEKPQPGEPEKPKAAPASNAPAPKSGGGGFTITNINDDGSVSVKDSSGKEMIAPSYVIQDVPELRDKLLKMGYWDKFPNVPGKPDPGEEEAQPQAPAEQPPQPGEPAKPKAASKQAAPQEIKIWKGADGQIRWSNKKGQVGGLTSKTVAKYKGKPEFVAALKAAKKKGFKPPEGYENLQEKFINPFQRANFFL